MTKLRRSSWRRIALLGLLVSVWPAQAQPAPEAANVERLRATTLALIEALVAQGLLTRERADALLRAADQPPPTGAGRWGDPPQSATPARPVQRIPFVPDSVRAQLREEVRNDVLKRMEEDGWAQPNALPPWVLAPNIPSWVRQVTIGGDIRVRAQTELFDRNNLPAEEYRLQNELASSPAWAPDLLNTTVDRHRVTLRARLQASARIGDTVGAGLRLSTGGTTVPASSSQTLGNQFNKLSVTLDRAFLTWEPHTHWRVIAGRMPGPFTNSSLVWPDDVSLDGALVERVFRGDPARGTAPDYSVRIGAFPLQEFAVDRRDKWLYALQAGVAWAPSWNASLTASMAIYDFHRIEGVREDLPPPTGPLEGTVPYLTSAYPVSARQKGNTLINLNDPTSLARPTWGLASRFRPWHAGVEARQLLEFLPYAVVLGADYVRNTAFDIVDIERRAGDTRVRVVAEKTKGFEVRAAIGTANQTRPGSWDLRLSWRQLERDAWPDAFTDTAWHGGGTGYKGWSLSGRYVLTDGLQLGWRWTSTRNLDDGVVSPLAPSGTLSSAPFKLDTVQVDLSTRF